MKLVYGVGINDMPRGSCSERVNGKQSVHPFYLKWKDMIKRCYYLKFQQEKPTYLGCSVCEEWKYLSKFKEWFDQHPLEKQHWHLDKDLLFPNNKMYSPETCILVPQWLNSFVTESKSIRGKYMIGVSWVKQKGKFKSGISDGTGKMRHLGHFTDELSAHLAWKSAKLQMVHDRKDELDEIDHRLYGALINRYS